MHLGIVATFNCYKSSKHLFSISVITLVQAGKEQFADGCWFMSYALSSSGLMDVLSEIACYLATWNRALMLLIFTEGFLCARRRSLF